MRFDIIANTSFCFICRICSVWAEENAAASSRAREARAILLCRQSSGLGVAATDNTFGWTEQIPFAVFLIFTDTG
jgi:hypothetical protein